MGIDKDDPKVIIIGLYNLYQQQFLWAEKKEEQEDFCDAKSAESRIQQYLAKVDHS